MSATGIAAAALALLALFLFYRVLLHDAASPGELDRLASGSAPTGRLGSCICSFASCIEPALYILFVARGVVTPLRNAGQNLVSMYALMQ